MYFVNYMIIKTNDKTDTFIQLLVVSAVSLILGMAILFPALNKVSSSQIEVLSLFLDIPDNTVKQLHSNCEIYLANIL